MEHWQVKTLGAQRGPPPFSEFHVWKVPPGFAEGAEWVADGAERESLVEFEVVVGGSRVIVRVMVSDSRRREGWGPPARPLHRYYNSQQLQYEIPLSPCSVPTYVRNMGASWGIPIWCVFVFLWIFPSYLSEIKAENRWQPNISSQNYLQPKRYGGGIINFCFCRKRGSHSRRKKKKNRTKITWHIMGLK